MIKNKQRNKQQNKNKQKTTTVVSWINNRKQNKNTTIKILT